jgi:hypothetical protein
MKITPVLRRMDLDGSLSFENFSVNAFLSSFNELFFKVMFKNKNICANRTRHFNIPNL